MRIQVLSDLHNEHHGFTPEPVDADVIILAGDIGIGEAGVRWAAKAFSAPVLYVPGNHEFYGGHLQDTLAAMRSAGGQRVRVLDREEVVIGRVRFLGATMWTDYASTGDVLKASELAYTAMPDFATTYTMDDREITPDDLAEIAWSTRAWLVEKLSAPYDGQTIVITHHAPLMKSLEGSPHAGGLLDAAFANEWDELFDGTASVWVHGHTHYAVDYIRSGTRVLSNPRGYPGEETGFSPSLVIDL